MKKIIITVFILCLGTLVIAQKPGTARVYTTAQNTELRLTRVGDVAFGLAEQPVESAISVFVNPNKQFQTHLGMGGAITDASAEVFAKLSPNNQQKLLEL